MEVAGFQLLDGTWGVRQVPLAPFNRCMQYAQVEISGNRRKILCRQVPRFGLVRITLSMYGDTQVVELHFAGLVGGKDVCVGRVCEVGSDATLCIMIAVEHYNRNTCLLELPQLLNEE